MLFNRSCSAVDRGSVGVNALKSWATRAYPDLWLIILGGLFVLIVLFMPKGLVDVIRKREFSLRKLARNLRGYAEQMKAAAPR